MKSRCPQCGKTVVYSLSNYWRPFCSERCKMIDLGDWIDEKNRIPDDMSAFEEMSDNSQEFKH